MQTSSADEELGDMEFKWGIKAGVGVIKKKLQFYESFVYNGEEYKLYDCVFMHKEGSGVPYIGKLIKIWEEAKESKKIRVQWFFRPSEISYWLQRQNVNVLEKEIFFASGEGLGLTNVNPLDAIAGKCNVVCLSQDVRNPQPSPEQLQMVDFVFYRTFDVGSCMILDIIGDKVGGLAVKFVFNRKENEMASGPKLVSKQKEDGSRTIICEGTSQILGNKAAEMLKNVKEGGNPSHLVAKEDVETKSALVEEESSRGHAEDLLDHSKQTPGTRPAPSVDVAVEVARASMDNKNPITNEGRDRRLRANQIKVVERVKSEKDPVKSKRVSASLNDRPSKREKLYGSIKFTSSKDLIKVEKSTATANDMKTSVPIDSKEKTKSGLNKELVWKDDRPSKKLKVNESVKMSDDNSNTTKKLNNLIGGSATKSLLVGESSTAVKPKSKLAKSFLALENSPSEEISSRQPNKPTGEAINLDKVTPMEMQDENTKKPIIDSSMLENCSTNGMFDVKMSDSIGVGKVPSEENTNEKKHKLTQSNLGIVVGTSKEKLDMKNSALPNNLARVSSASTDANEKIKGRIFEVTRRPNADRGKWFLSPPWEEKMLAADEERALVLLQNLEPDYTSSEVEDIVWHAFKENCTAKVVQRTAFSSPHIGQALVAFKSREAAERVIKQLKDRCLIVSNHRPLVGCIAVLPKFQGKQSTLVGHLCIDKMKLQYMKKETKDAVWTSHFSQPNTVTFELATEWCLLQSKTDIWWKSIYKQQWEELKRAMASLKQIK